MPSSELLTFHVNPPQKNRLKPHCCLFDTETHISHMVFAALVFKHGQTAYYYIFLFNILCSPWYLVLRAREDKKNQNCDDSLLKLLLFDLRRHSGEK